MLNSIKSISLGIVSLLGLGLINQLVLIMLAVGFSLLVKNYPVLMPWSQTFTYVMGGLGHFVVMSLTGVVVAMASIANRACINTAVAAIIGSSISLYLSLRNDIFTPIAFIFLTSAIVFALLGCWFWQRRVNRKLLVNHHQ